MDELRAAAGAGDGSAGEDSSPGGRVAAATRTGAVLVWYFWTLPFRLGCSLGLMLFVRLVARPTDFAQEQLFGRRVVGLERSTFRVVTAIRPMWRRLFPFKDDASQRRERRASSVMQLQYQQFQQFQQQQQQMQQMQQEGGQGPGSGVPAYSQGLPQPPALHQRPGRRVSQQQQQQPQQQPHSRGSLRQRTRGRADESSVDDDDELEDDDDDDDDEDEDESMDGAFYGGPTQPRRRPSATPEEEAPLPPSAATATAAEIDHAVMLAIEAKQTHAVVEKLFWIAVMLMTVIGMVLVRIDFTRAWYTSTDNSGVEPALAFEGVYGVLVVLTIAFRSDFPFNLGVLMLVVFFSGIVFGTIIARSAFSFHPGGGGQGTATA